ncbi:hypothetical protein GF352_03615 [archaeon]|nr:hypothetical protein [archaeon]
MVGKKAVKDDNSLIPQGLGVLESRKYMALIKSYIDLSLVIDGEINPDEVEDSFNKLVYTIGGKHYIKI